MDLITGLASVASCITTICAAIVLLVRPVRERVMGTRHIAEGQKCLLRSDMLRMYYRHRDEKKIRQYEYENIVHEYAAYKALKGNSFMDKVYAEIESWEVIS